MFINRVIVSIYYQRYVRVNCCPKDDDILIANSSAVLTQEYICKRVVDPSKVEIDGVASEGDETALYRSISIIYSLNSGKTNVRKCFQCSRRVEQSCKSTNVRNSFDDFFLEQLTRSFHQHQGC